MSILQLLLLPFVLAGAFRAYQGISAFLTRHTWLRLAPHADKTAFVAVVVSAAMIAAPTLALRLPVSFVLFTWGLYLVYAAAGAWWIWDYAAARIRRGGPSK